MSRRVFSTVLLAPQCSACRFEGEILSAVPVRTMYPRLNCEPHQYSKYGQLFFTDLATALKRMIGLGKPFPAGLNPGMGSLHAVLASVHVLGLPSTPLRK